MGSEFTETPLSAVADLKGGFAFRSSDYTDSGRFVLRTVNITDRGTITRDGATYISEELAASFERFELQPHDTLFVMVGATLGKVGYVRQQDLPALLNQNMWVIRSKDKEIANPRFLNYWFSQKVKETLHWASGSARSFVRRDDYRNLPFPQVAPEIQKAIAHILGTLDDKIELNRRMNATLEGMAQALFKSWFVDFDPVIDKALAEGHPIPEPLHKRAEARRALGEKRKPLPAAIQQHFPSRFDFSKEMGWVPEGWEVTKLSELLEVKYGKDHKKLNEGSIPVYGSGGLMRHADNSLHKGESVLIPRKGTLSNILYLNEEFWTVDTMFYTIPKRKFVPKFAFYHLKGLDFESMNVGSAVPSMTTKVLNDLPILKPTEAVLQDFDFFLTSYFDKRDANKAGSFALSSLRDTLLPKLLSGQLRIPDAEKLIEETL